MARFAAMGFALALVSCSLANAVVGSGPVTNETRQVDAFDKVVFNGGIQFELKIGTPQSVVVAAQQNLLAITTTTVASGKLTIETNRIYTTTVPIHVTVTVPTLSAITINGGVSGTATGINATGLSIEANGGASLTISGTATTLQLTCNAGSHVDGTDFIAGNATVDMNAGASATVGVTGTVTGSANAGASLHLLSNPTSVNVTTNAGASVTH
jgi:putative autotransporter adhesin-like protein